MQEYINQSFYPCDDQMVLELAWIYEHDDMFKQNIDKMGGQGTASFAYQAIQYYYTISEEDE